jgi:hypothetical protein
LKIILFLLFTIYSFNFFSQKLNAQLGLLINFGTKVNAIGISANVNFQYAFTQTNIFSSIKYNLTSYGKRKSFFESRTGAGLILLAGKKNIVADFHFDGLNHNTNYQYALGFNYLIYNDNIGTSQLSGAWSLHVNYFSLLFENDVFGGQAKDRFRTGVIQINYRYKEFKFFSNLYIWTGETKNSIWIKEKSKACPNGYRSLENLPYGKTSHGILSVGTHYSALFNQLFTTKIGVESEQIRHFLQNRLSHDLILLPKSYPRTTPHYPRLNREGKPIFNKKERKKDQLYFQINLNEVWSN